MATVPEPMHTTAALIYRAYEADANDGNRPHLGASLIGHACERNLWLTFRWAKKPKWPGRMLRLFETGQLEEPRIVANLRRIGVQVHETAPDGKQWRVSAIGGHFGGSMDAAAVGLPEAPKTWHVLEFKTHNDKSFRELVAKGVEDAKPMHYAQMQTYMGLTGMERALYFAVCKNDDTIYTERVEFDQVAFAKIMERAERVITAAEPPLRCSNDPSWYTCKMCDYHSLCHGEEAPDVSCRTCAHSTPLTDSEDGKWTCNQFGEIGLLAQRESHQCSAHRYIPIMLERFGMQKDVVDGDVVYEHQHGTFTNGQGHGALSSVEIKACEQKVMLADLAALKGNLQAQGITTAKVVA
jgi:hypothetical protein